MTTAMRWLGALGAVGNTFLVQELVRTLFEHMDRVSEGERFVRGGWLRLSGAAWPATWLYWLSHVWILAAWYEWRKSGGSQRLSGIDRALSVIVPFEILVIHALVLTFRDSWLVEPSILW